ncbi:hypothetical protein DOY81_009862 [Sarcophaga bullata]|nr:hypothetical protein DOY81_009862 [Sarcophaga bullata]
MHSVVAIMNLLQTPKATIAAATSAAVTLLLAYGLLGLLITLPVTTAGPHEKRLLHALLDNYNSLERPVVNESDPLQLSFGLTLMQIIDVVSVCV